MPIGTEGDLLRRCDTCEIAQVGAGGAVVFANCVAVVVGDIKLPVRSEFQVDRPVKTACAAQHKSSQFRAGADVDFDDVAEIYITHVKIAVGSEGHA